MAALEETTMVAEAVEEPVVEELVVEEPVAAAEGAGAPSLSTNEFSL